MPRVARFKVAGRFTAGGLSQGTVSIDRTENALFSVRPLHRKRTYDLPLKAVAEFVVWHVTRRELKDKKAAKKRERKLKSKSRSVV